MGERPWKRCRTPAAPSRHRVEGSREAAVPVRGEKAEGRQVCLGSGRGETKHPLLGQQSPAKREKGRLEEAAFNLQECGEGW